MHSRHIAYLKAFLFCLCLLPLLGIVWDGIHDQLGANPIEKITRRLGDWALRFLLITLSVSPLQRLSKRVWLLQFRRMLGLYCFFYASLHLSSYVILDQFFSWSDIWEDIVKRPYITIGMLCFLSLVPLAITSTRRMRIKLGRHWAALHSFIYPISAGAVIHYLLMVKADTATPEVYGYLLFFLLIFRCFPSAPIIARKNSSNP